MRRKSWELRGQLACLAAVVKVLWSTVPSVVIQPQLPSDARA